MGFRVYASRIKRERARGVGVHVLPDFVFISVMIRTKRPPASWVATDEQLHAILVPRKLQVCVEAALSRERYTALLAGIGFVPPVC